MGVTGADDPTLDKISPISHVASVSAPVLLIHGRDDTIVPYRASSWPMPWSAPASRWS